MSSLVNFDDDGDGPRPTALYAAGYFSFVGGVPMRYAARWDGEAWSSLGSGTELSSGWGVLAQAVYDEDGDGPDPPRLFLGGNFRVTIYGQLYSAGLVRWDGQTFTRVGDGPGGIVSSLYVWDEDGAGPGREALYVGGVRFVRNEQTTHGVVKWDGQSWSALAFGSNWGIGSNYGGAMAAFDEDGDGPGPQHLYFAGACLTGGGQGIARWNGATWELVGGGFSSPTAFEFGSALCVFDEDGAGPNNPSLFMGGTFYSIGGVETRGIVRWDGIAWSALGPVPDLWALMVFDEDGAGPAAEALYAAGDYGFLQRWNGTAWSSPGAGSLTVSDGTPNASGFSLCSSVSNGAPNLYVGGNFTGAFGVPSQCVAEYVGCAPSCPSDVDGDQVVDLSDLTIVLSNFGLAQGAMLEQGDLDGDGDVDLNDLTLLLAAFGTTC